MTRSKYHALPHLGLIQFSGDDAKAFLANLLTCDVNSLGPSRSTYGAFCTPKGRMLASFLLWRSEQGYFMQLPASLREPIQKQLTKFILRSKVKAADASSDWVLIGVDGKDSAALVQQVIGQSPNAAHDVVHVDGTTVLKLPGDRYEIAAPRDKAHLILEALAAGADKSDQERWEWLDIQAGIPTITPATQEMFVPQMVNLDLLGGVSFEKGCYPGQEIVARMHYRGTLKQRMYLAHIDGADSPQAGDKLYSADFGEQACGTIVNAARSPEGGYDILAVIQIASAGKDNVRWKASGGPALRPLPLPYAVSASD